MRVAEQELAAAFLAGLPPERAHGADPREVGAILRDHLDESHASFSETWLAPEAWAAHLAALVSPDVPLATALGRLHAADVYLSCACAAGHPAAVRAFQELYAPEVDQAFTRSNTPSLSRDDFRQSIWERLLVRRGHEAPAIAGYSGQGPLSHWVRISVVRALIDRSRSDNRKPPQVQIADQTVEVLLADSDEPELEFIKSRYRGEFREAVRDALLSLSPADQALMKFSVVDGLSIDDLATVYSIHRATAARRLAKARTALVEQVRACFADRLHVSQPEYESIMRLIRSRVDLAIGELV